MKKLLIALLIVGSPFLLAQEKGKRKKLKPGVYAHLTTTLGAFTIELYPGKAPKAVENFTGLAEGTREWVHPTTRQPVKSRYYDGLIFHRVVPGAVIQGGDPLGNGTGDPGFTFEDEFHADLKHDREGRLSMANRGRNTNGSQFFLSLRAVPSLDGKHTIFGQVIDGMDVIRKIGSVKTDPLTEKPLTDVVIRSVEIERVNK